MNKDPTVAGIANVYPVASTIAQSSLLHQYTTHHSVLFVDIKSITFGIGLSQDYSCIVI